MISLLKKKIEKALTPETTTLTDFSIEFTTIDGVVHKYDNVALCDESPLKCSGLEYYLCNEDFLRDNDGVMYPMKNIIAIKQIVNRYIPHVKKKAYDKGLAFYRTWYQPEEVEIIEEK